MTATDSQFDAASALATRLDQEIGRVIIGQHQVRREVLVCLLAGDTACCEGFPVWPRPS